MLVRHSTKPLPRRFSSGRWSKDIAAEADIRVSERSRLRAKVLVFQNRAALLKCWKERLGSPTGRGTLGVVQAHAHERIQVTPDKERACLIVDPRYFCVIGLVKGHLTMEIISHEAVHAGFCYAKRQARDFWIDATELDEESVAYPAGRIARAITEFAYETKLI